MGNANKIVSDRDAKEILSQENWFRLKRQLEKYYDRYLDYESFQAILRNRYDRMPKVLCELLYKAFTDNLNRKIAIDEFVISLAVFCNTSITIFNDSSTSSNSSNSSSASIKEQRKTILNFIFRIYDVQTIGKIDKGKVEKILTLAYDSINLINSNLMLVMNTTYPSLLNTILNGNNNGTNKASLMAYKAQFEALFANTKERGFISLKEFENYTGQVELLTGWVQSVIHTLCYPVSPNLYNLELKYNFAMEKVEIMKKYNVSEPFVIQLRHTFLACIACNGHLLESVSKTASAGKVSGNNGGSTNESNNETASANINAYARPEMTLSTWINVTKSFLPLPLACCMFCSKIKSLKIVWRFAEFAEFCIVFGSQAAIQQKIDYLVFVFQYEGSRVLRNNLDGTANKAYKANSANQDLYGDRSHLRRVLRLLAFTEEFMSSLRPSLSAAASAASHTPGKPRSVVFSASAAGATAASDKSEASSAASISPRAVIHNAGTAPAPAVNRGSVSIAGKASTLPPIALVTPKRPTHTELSLSTPHAGPPMDANSPGSPISGGASGDNVTASRHRRTSLVSSKFSDYKRPNLQTPTSSRVSVHIAQNHQSYEDADVSTGTYGLPYIWDPYIDNGIEVIALPSKDLQTEWNALERDSSASSDGILWSKFTALLLKHEQVLVNIQLLEMLTCCSFGIRPLVASKEKAFITILTEHVHNVNNPEGVHIGLSQPHGPPGTEWAVINKAWYDNWLAYTTSFTPTPSAATTPTAAAASTSSSTNGNSHVNTISSKMKSAVSFNSSSSSAAASAVASNKLANGGPGNIDNVSILVRGGNGQQYSGSGGGGAARILQANLAIGRQIEIIPVAAFNVLLSWYGGGPRLIRKVVSMSHNHSHQQTAIATTHKPFAAGATPTNVSYNAVTDLELYPICLKVLFCTAQGKIIPESYGDVLYSKTDTIETILRDLCENANIDMKRGRLWNFHNYNINDSASGSPSAAGAGVGGLNKAQSTGVDDTSGQFILPIELTVARANLKDQQFVLFEVCQEDGSWPRSSQATPSALAAKQTTGGNTLNNSANANDNSSSVVDIRTNDGRIGLDNLGNTCYMNSSLQALLHTGPLTEYFLRNYYSRDLNTGSKFGYKGKVAQCYAKLVKDLWATDKDVITPKPFHSEFTSLMSQFNGHDQHDAQEMLACLLDGLSEDMNLVQNKPYIENPDSDGRPDHELADLWWINHFKRENSVVQTVFSGQLKSVVTCGCGHYSSARYEPFCFLTLPVPEESERRITIFLMIYNQTSAMECVVTVGKDQEIKHLIEKMYDLNIPGIIPQSAETSKNSNSYWDSQFLVGEVSNSMVLGLVDTSRKVSSIKDSENIFLFQIPTIASLTSAMGVTAGDSGSPTTAAVKTAGTVVKAAAVPAPRPVSPRGFAQVAVTGAVAKTAGAGAVASKSSTLLKTYINNQCFRRVIFMQRRSRLFDGGGIEIYRMESFGLPFVEVISEKMTGRELYERVAKRAMAYMKMKSSSSGSGSGSSSSSSSGIHRTESADAHSAAVVLALESTSKESSSTTPYNFEKYASSYDWLAVTRQAPPGQIPTGVELGTAANGKSDDMSKANGEATAGGSTGNLLSLPMRSNSGNAGLMGGGNMSANNAASNATTQNNALSSSNARPYITRYTVPHTPAVTEHLLTQYRSVQSTYPRIKPVNTDNITGGVIPKYGFVLRTVLGNWVPGSGSVCSRCPWLAGCHGCLLPDDDLLLCESLHDEEVIAVDWHFVVYEEFVDPLLASDIRKHSSVESEADRAKQNIIPFAKCLNKFTEEESIEGITCPKCKADNRMRKALSIWRGPPVLMVQLKRFQFDAIARRKLVDKVDFPFTNFDISYYYPPTHPYHQKSSSAAAAAISGGSGVGSKLCHEYDLYAIVHHVGRLGDGHYVATVLQDKIIDDEDAAAGGAVPSLSHKGGEAEQEWVCFNDNAISIMEASELQGAPTAYMLFYLRKDMRDKSIDDLFGPGGPLGLPSLPPLAAGRNSANSVKAPSSKPSSVGSAAQLHNDENGRSSGSANGNAPLTPNRKGRTNSQTSTYSNSGTGGVGAGAAGAGTKVNINTAASSSSNISSSNAPPPPQQQQPQQQAPRKKSMDDASVATTGYTANVKTNKKKSCVLQ